MRMAILPGIAAAASILAGTAAAAAMPATQAGPMLPRVYEPQVLERYAALSDSGYTLAGDGKFDEAVSLFRSADALIPAARSAGYNDAFAVLGAAVAAGYDDPDALKEDPELASLRGDARFPDLVQRAGANRAAHE